MDYESVLKAIKGYFEGKGFEKVLNVWTNDFLEVEVVENDFGVPFLCVYSVELVYELFVKFPLPTDTEKLFKIFKDFDL